MRPSTTHAFRAHPLDDAMLYFHPSTGTCVRVETNETRGLVRAAPRVVMFGITNLCNLRCDFCSRDVTRASAWTVASAAEVLEGLARAGTLEVAFGGGEPFAFRGFADLLLRLQKTTSLALNVTTNGTVLTESLLAQLAGVLGQVRVSIYDDTPWRPMAQLLFRAGQTWGANVIASDGALARLPDLLLELTALGARDVSLLSYVGPDETMVLSARGETTLAAIISASPIPCRVSVCFGKRLHVARLFDGVDDAGDCGAGLDFLSITPDKRAQSCSFQDASFPIESAEDALSVWRARREELQIASPRAGCARSDSTAERSATDPASERARTTGTIAREKTSTIRVWQSFSGNNSGECILVSKFEKADDAEKLLAELIPGWVPGEPYSAPWNELFAREGTVSKERSDGRAPDEMIALGRSFIARTDYAPGDDFPELRALVWKRGGEVIAGGIHVHDGATALAVIRATDAADATSLLARAKGLGAVAARHGLDVIVALSIRARPKLDPKAPDTPLAWQRDTLKELAAGRPFALELVFEPVDDHALVGAAKSLASRPTERPRLLLSFFGYGNGDQSKEHARALASEIAGATAVENIVLVDNVVRKKRLAIHGHNANAGVTSLSGESVLVWSQLWREPAPRTKGRKAPEVPPLETSDVERDLPARLRLELEEKHFAIEECGPESWGDRVRVRVRTAAPAEVLTAIASYAKENELRTWLGVYDADVLERATRRLIADVDDLERDAR